MTTRLGPCFSTSVVLFTLWLAGSARACIPVGGMEPPCSAYWKADAVFAGVVSETTKAPREPNERFDKLLILFKVVESYRGVDTRRIEVATITGTECDMKILEGEKWLVYARRDPESDRLQVSSRTKLYSGADEDLSYISSLSRGSTESSVLGGAFDYPYTPWEGINIQIRGNGQKYDVTTDKNGQFTVPAVKPGRYVIRAIFPAESGPVITGDRMPRDIKETGPAPMIEYEINIDPGRCEFVQFFGRRRETKSGQD